MPVPAKKGAVKKAAAATRAQSDGKAHTADGRPRHQRLSAAERRAKIIEASRRVFLRSGLTGTRTRDLALEAGIAEAMIYRHFSSKEELFEAAILQPLEDLIEQMIRQSEVISLLDGRTRLTVATDIQRQLCMAMVDIVPLLGVALFSDYESGRKFWAKRVVPLIDQASDSMREMRKGWKHSPIDPRLQFLALLGMHLSVALDAHFRNRPVDCDEVAREFARFAAKGVQP